MVFFITPGLRAQDFDLIVIKDGDSIACRIDSISNSKIYLEMKAQGTWVRTEIALDKIQHYEYRAINRQDYVFKSGSSTIESRLEKRLQKNSVYVGLGSLCYGRTFPLGTANIAVAGGLAWPDGLGMYLESTVFMGKRKHFFETGLATALLPDEGSVEAVGIIIRAGYRYQGPKGFLFRSAPTIGFFDGDIMPLPALSFGYSF
jgi:hypothetical protein